MKKSIFSFIKTLLLIIFTNLLCIGISLSAVKNVDSGKITYAPEGYFFDREGNKKYLEEFEENYILLVLWASWCGDCLSEIYSLDYLAKDFKKLPFKIIALSQDYQGTDIVRDYYEKNNIRHLDIYYDKNNQLYREIGSPSLPRAYLIDKQSRIIEEYKGKVKWQDDKVRSSLLEKIDGLHELPKNSYKEKLIN